MARALYPAVTDYAFYGHAGDEAGHARLLRYLGADPILRLGMRLGEGTGAICAFPILDSAARMLREHGLLHHLWCHRLRQLCRVAPSSFAHD